MSMAHWKSDCPLPFAINRNLCYIDFVPKKTKQEKIITDLRRKLTEQGEAKVMSSASGYENVEKKETIKLVLNPTLTSRPTTQNSSAPLPQTSINYIKKDLLKTLILSLVAISFELMIYWAWNR